MRGIAGIHAYHYATNPLEREELEQICHQMQPGGGGECSTWQSTDNRSALCLCSQFAIPRDERQPLVSADGMKTIVFDGLLYNGDQLLAKSMEQTVSTRSHAEIVLKLYEQKGEKFARYLRGAFSVAIWDARRGGLLLARDPFGIKPLYYADDGWSVRFASQVKALLASNRVSKTRDPAGLVSFLLSGEVPEPLTTYQEIRSVPVGSSLWIDRIGVRAAQSYVPEVGAPELHAGAAANARLQDRTLPSCMMQRYLGLGPIGVISQGNTDAAAIFLSSLGEQERRGLQTLSLSYGRAPSQHRDHLQTIARRYGVVHTNVSVSKEEFEADLHAVLASMDQPTVGDISAWFFSKAARKLGLGNIVSPLGCGALFDKSKPQYHADLFKPGELKSLIGEQGARIGLRRLRRMHRRKTGGTLDASCGKAGVRTSGGLLGGTLRNNYWASKAFAVQMHYPFLDLDLRNQLESSAGTGAQRPRNDSQETPWFLLGNSSVKNWALQAARL